MHYSFEGYLENVLNNIKANNIEFKLRLANRREIKLFLSISKNKQTRESKSNGAKMYLISKDSIS